jgi:hypothetical protein
MKTINSAQSLQAYKDYLDAQFKKHKYLQVTIKTGRQRTTTQNASLHKYCQLLADELNEQGQDFRLFMKEGYEVPFTQDLVKEHIWKPVQKAMFGIDSTTKADRTQYSAIYDVLNRKMAEYGVYVPWPSEEARGE